MDACARALIRAASSDGGASGMRCSSSATAWWTAAPSGTGGRETTMEGWPLGTGSSSGATMSSTTFSPGRAPTIAMGMSRPGTLPDSRMSRSARSMIRTGSPMSRVNTSPPVDRAAACSTSCTASWTLMKYLVILGPVAHEHPEHALTVADVGQDGLDPRRVGGGVVGVHLALARPHLVQRHHRLVQMGLVVVEQHQRGR